MKKVDVIEYAKIMSGMGYITHLMLLDLYDDEDDVPGDVVDLVVHKATVRPLVLYGSADLIDLLGKSMGDLLDRPKK